MTTKETPVMAVILALINDKGLTEDEVETMLYDAMDEWHSGLYDQPMHEFLGLDEEDYKLFVMEPDVFYDMVVSGIIQPEVEDYD